MRLLALFSLLALTACDSVGDGPPVIDAIDAEVGVEVESGDALRAYREAWEAASVDDYRLRYEVFCFCAGPRVYDLRVEDGRIVDVWINGEPAPEDPAISVLTVDALYAQAERGFDEADRTFVRVRAEAPPLPVTVSIDYSVEVADEEIGYRILGFERVRP